MFRTRWSRRTGIPQYIDLLCEELRQTAEIAKKLSLRLETIYIGGGTPTSVTDKQLEEIMSAVAENFPVQSAAEYTVEAGRPDTVTREKLEVIKRMGASRISINPQTMNDDVQKHRQSTPPRNGRGFRLARNAASKT
ncbi:MAG: radical SAM protein [Oscillospiraceae bacterium]